MGFCFAVALHFCVVFRLNVALVGYLFCAGVRFVNCGWSRELGIVGYSWCRVVILPRCFVFLLSACAFDSLEFSVRLL